MTKLTAVAAGTLAGMLALGTAANAETFVLRFGSGHPSKPTPYVRNMEHYLADEITKRVAAETKHKVRIIHAYAGKIAKVHETLEAVEKGLLDIGGWCVCFESAKMLPMNFDYFTPFTTGDIRRQLAVKLRLMAEHPELYDMLDKKYNQKLIALTGFDNYGLGTKFEWTDVNQLKGQEDHRRRSEPSVGRALRRDPRHDDAADRLQCAGYRRGPRVHHVSRGVFRLQVP